MSTVDPLTIHSSSDDDSPPLPKVLKRRHSHVAAEGLGLRPKSYRRLRRMQVPSIFLQLLAFVAHLNQGVPRHDVVEYYAGVGAISDAARNRGLMAASFEISADPVWQNANSEAGLITMISHAFLLVSCGLAHWATPCSTWIWLSRSKTGRSTRRPAGVTRFTKAPCPIPWLYL